MPWSFARRRYREHSKVEAAFGMIERKFGDVVRSQGDLAMANEVLAKLVCHNLCCLISAMYEMGVNPVFWVEPSQVG
jgi:hypothetical protein